MELPFNFDDFAYYRLVATILVILTAIVLNKIAQGLIIKYVNEPELRYRTAKVTRKGLAFLSIIAIIALWAEGLRVALTVLTVVGAGVAIAMRETVLSFAGWIHILIRVPFKQGDRIEINGVRGDVLDIKIMHTTVMEIGEWVSADQSTGRLMHIPNNWIFQHALKNYTRGFKFIWNELSVVVTFRSDWQRAREIVLQHAQESAAIVERQAEREIRDMAREYLVHFAILTPFVYVMVVENGVRLTLRYLCEARKRRGTEHALTMAILKSFQENGGIELAYPMVGVAPFATPQFGPVPDPDDPAYRRIFDPVAENRSASPSDS